jgi:hypothetical protein
MSSPWCNMRTAYRCVTPWSASPASNRRRGDAQGVLFAFILARHLLPEGLSLFGELQAKPNFMPDWIGDQMAGVGPEAMRGLRPECANSGHRRWLANGSIDL